MRGHPLGPLRQRAQPEWLTNNIDLFLTALDAGVEIRALVIDGPLLGSSQGWKGTRGLSGLFVWGR